MPSPTPGASTIRPRMSGPVLCGPIQSYPSSGPFELSPTFHGSTRHGSTGTVPGAPKVNPRSKFPINPSQEPDDSDGFLSSFAELERKTSASLLAAHGALPTPPESRVTSLTIQNDEPTPFRSPFAALPSLGDSIMSTRLPSPLFLERRFKCDQCPQCFNRNFDLKRHKRIHLELKPFPCSSCDRSFSRKDALKVRFDHPFLLISLWGTSHPTQAGREFLHPKSDTDVF